MATRTALLRVRRRRARPGAQVGWTTGEDSVQPAPACSHAPCLNSLRDVAPRIVWAKFEEGRCTDQVGDFKLGKLNPMRCDACTCRGVAQAEGSTGSG